MLKRTPIKRTGSRLRLSRQKRATGLVRGYGGIKRAKSRDGVWTLKKADAVFSQEIRSRDGFCQFPGCLVSDPAKLQCSHYHGRAIKNTRYDPDNCIALCWFHHFKDKLLGFEYQKQQKHKHGHDGQYTLFMIKRLGQRRFNLLNARSRRHITQKRAITNFQRNSY